MIDNSKNPNVKEIYKDAQGNRWFALINPLEISAIRGIAAQRANRFITLGLSETEMKLLLDEHDKAAKEMNIVKCFGIINEMRYRLEMITEENSVLDLAGIYYFLKDEDPNLISPTHDSKKRVIWESDPACRAFFLRMGLQLMKKLKDIPLEDSLNYLAKVKHLAERIYQHIPLPHQR